MPGHLTAEDPHWRIDKQIELRVVQTEDAEALYALTDKNRAHLRQWLPWLDFNRSVADTAAYISMSLQQFNAGKGFNAAIWFENKLCGVIGHHSIDLPNRSASLGYWLDAFHQGKGIMTRACGAMVSHAFAELRLHRVVIRCATENHRSRAIPQRLGFRLEGIERGAEWLYDHFVDLAVYSLLEDEHARPPRAGMANSK